MVDTPQETSPMNTSETPQTESATLLHEGLHRFESQWKHQQRRLGGGRFLLAAVGLFLLAAGLDLSLTPEGMTRVGLSLLFYLSLAIAAWFLWWRPVLRPLSAEKIAWMIEESHPELNEKLISAVELEKEREGNVSRAMILQTIADTEVDLGRVDPEQDLAPPRWLKLLPVTVGVLLLMLMLVPGLHLPLRMKRILMPTARDAAVSTYALRWVLAPESHAVENTPVTVAVERTRDTGEDVVLEIRGEQNQRVALPWNSETNRFEGEFTLPNHPVWVFARSGGAATSRVYVQPRLRPWIESLTLEIHAPDYTGAPVRELDSWPRELEMVEGSRLRLRVTGNEPLSEVRVTSEQQENTLALSGGRVAEGAWVPEQSGEFTLLVKDAEGLEPLEAPLMQVRLLPDLPPTVRWIAPETDLLLREGDSLPLVWMAADDFGVAESIILIRKNSDSEVRVVVSPVNGTYTYDVSDWALGGGDELRVRVMAEDALGQTGESPVRTLSVAGGLYHPEAQNYLRELAALRTHLGGMEPTLTALRLAGAGIFEAKVHETPSALENLEFQRARWQLATRDVDSNLNTGRSRADALRALSFFAAGDPALELLSRYMEQERVRLHTTNPETLMTGPGVAGVYELGLPLLEELERRAGFALPTLQAARLETMVALVAPRTDAASRRLLEDLRHRAVIFAARHAPETVESLRALDLRPETGEPAPGLQRWMWLGRGTYTYDTGHAGSKMETEAKIEYPELPAMGLENSQVVSILWMGRVRAERAGIYRFELESDDGSRLYVGDHLVLQNDGSHPMQRRSGEMELSPGLHPIRIVYFNSGGGGGILFRWQPPGQSEWAVVPADALFAPGNLGAMTLRSTVSGLRARLARESVNFAELERWMRLIRERLDSERSPLPQMLAEVASEAFRPELSARIAAEAEALRLRAEAEQDATMARLADELARAGLREDADAVRELLNAIAEVQRDRTQEDWVRRLRDETQAALELMRGLEDISGLEAEAEHRAQVREEAERLRALAEALPATGTDQQHESDLRDAARDLRRIAEEMEKREGEPAERAAAMERSLENLETGLGRAEDASVQAVEQAEDRLRAALPAGSEEMAASAERLAAADDALAALAQEREGLEAVLQNLREPLDLRREEDRRISPEDVRDQRMAEALERQIASRDPAAVRAALEEMQPLAAAQEKARREALTQGEEAALSQALREATEPVLSPAEAEAFDRMERLAEEVARARAALENPDQPQSSSTPLSRDERAQLEAAAQHMRPLDNELARARLREETEQPASEVRKSLEQAFRESERLQNELKKLNTPESARLQEMAESVERQMRAEFVKGAEETLAAMARQMDEWAGEDPVAPRLAREAEAAGPASEDALQQMARAAEALDRAAAFEDAVPPSLESAKNLAEGSQLAQALAEAQSSAENPHAGPAREQLAAAAESMASQTDNAEALARAQEAQAQAEQGQWEQAAAKARLAAEALRDAAPSLAVTLAQAAETPSDAPGTEPGQGESSTPSTAQGGSPAESQGGAEEGLWKGPQGGAWQGPASSLDTGDPRRAGRQYSPYYRQAIQQYMRDLQEEQQP